MAGLEEREVEEYGVKRMRVVARKEYHPHEMHHAIKTASKKSKMAARYRRDTAKSREKRQAFDEESWNRMNYILTHKVRWEKR